MGLILGDSDLHEVGATENILLQLKIVTTLLAEYNDI